MTTTQSARRRTISPEAKAAKDQAVTEAYETIKAEVSKIRTSEEWKAWLRLAAKFHSYSFNNVLLMHLQAAARGMAPLTHVAAYGRWQELGRQVRKGETGLRIFAPIIVKLKEGDKGYDPEVTKTRLVGFRLVSVFDAQQTEGEPLPAPPVEGVAPSGPVSEGLTAKLEAWSLANGYPVSQGPTGRADGYTSPLEKVIRISDRIEHGTAHYVAVLLHEVAHSLLHMDPDYGYTQHRGTAETEAESVAFVAGTVLGIDMESESFTYVAGWDSDEAILKSGQRIMATAKAILAALED